MNERDVPGMDSLEKCPICAGKLERGYAIAYRWLWWDYERHAWRGGQKLLTKYPAWNNTNFPALRCWKCHIIIFDYERKK
jgi:hypothetical protein